jgi:hypothetical protein
LDPPLARRTPDAAEVALDRPRPGFISKKFQRQRQAQRERQVCGQALQPDRWLPYHHRLIIVQELHVERL